MRAESFLCLGGVEIARGPRVLDYVREGLAGASFLAGNCDCDAIDNGPYESPLIDPAPWYQATRPESAQFLGLLATGITLSAVPGRSVRPVARGGAVVGPMSPGPRLVEVTGYLVADTYQGMGWGERWLTEALQGAYCRPGCAEDELELLPVCPEEPDTDRFFRTLRRTGLTDGPIFIGVGEIAECKLQEVRFTLTAGSPWLLSPPASVIDATVSSGGGSECGLVSTLSWNGDKTMEITLTAPESGDATSLVVEVNGAPSGSCPDTSTEPYVRYTIATLEAGHSVTIDGAGREVTSYDATRKLNVAGMNLLDFEGLFSWPDVPPESDVCVCITNNGARNITAEVNEIGREL